MSKKLLKLVKAFLNTMLSSFPSIVFEKTDDVLRDGYFVHLTDIYGSKTIIRITDIGIISITGRASYRVLDVLYGIETLLNEDNFKYKLSIVDKVIEDLKELD